GRLPRARARALHPASGAQGELPHVLRSVAVRQAALVTGGARGIGLGISRALAREGPDFALCGPRDEAAGAPRVGELGKLGAEVHYRRADVADTAALRRMVADARERLGRLHVLVNNAGVAPLERRDILEATEESFDHVIRTNLRGPYFLTQAVARWM